MLNRQYIILDTCIIQYLATKHLKNDLLWYFTQLIRDNIDLAISEISVYEIFCEAGKSKKEEIHKILKDISKRFSVDKKVLMMAAALFSMYSRNKISKEQISTADRIIAATSVLSGFFILTGNINDFPRPYFIEVDIKKIFYKKKNKDLMQVLYLLKPDYVVIKKEFERNM